MIVRRQLAAEALGTGMLVATVVGSGIMGERLAGGSVAIALLANTLATGAILVALILSFGSISTHFNPAVTVAMALRGAIPWRTVPAFAAAQVVGGIAGTVAAHAMFELPLFMVSQHARTGAAQWVAEFIASFGLLTVIWGTLRHRREHVAFSVAAYITAAYWFTASTSFANPAVTVARALSDTFAGIRPADVPAFVLMQVAGASAATALSAWLTADGAA